MNAKRKALQALKEAGYIFRRSGGEHDIYFNPKLGTIIPIRHSFGEDDLKVILREINQNRKEER